MAKGHRRGFTLIELSIVLLIIALIVGGILVGRDLIRSAELRKRYQQYESIKTAVNTFREKYHCLAGDCINAEDFFGTNPNCPDTTGATHGVPADFRDQSPGLPTCNGDGDGSIDTNNTLYEMALFWQQLGDANLVAGVYSGSLTTGDIWFVPGHDCPVMVSNAFCWVPIAGKNSVLFDMGGFDGPGLVAGKGSGTMLMAGTTSDAMQPFSPAEALAYDRKFDDGSPVTGNIIELVSFGTSHCTDVADENVQDPSYATAQWLTNDPNYKDAPGCNLVYRTNF